MSYWIGKCSECGWFGSTSQCKGSEDSAYCPNCFDHNEKTNEVSEATGEDFDIEIKDIRNETITEFLRRCEERLVDSLEWEWLYKQLQQIAKEMREG